MNNVQPRRTAPRTSALIHNDQLDDSRPILVMVSGCLLVVFSFILSGVAFHGGDWRAAFTQPSAARWALAFGVQAYCTVMEWFNRKRKASPWYWSALILDMLSSVGGLLAPVRLLLYVFVGMLWPVVYNSLGVTPVGATIPISRLLVLEWAIALAFAFGVARVPEDKLIAG